MTINARMNSNKPFFKYVALSAWPHSGKDEVAKAFVRHANAELVDDGLPLRLAAPLLYGFDESLPFTQEGKATLVDTPNGQETVRVLLGDLGKQQEAKYGNGFMPFRALQMCAEVERRAMVPCFVFPSVRRDQGAHYKRLRPGEVLHLEIRRPGVGDSGNDFDQWDAASVDHIIQNDGTLEQLDARVADIIKYYTQCRNTRPMSHH